jgi:hypothetical protein
MNRTVLNIVLIIIIVVLVGLMIWGIAFSGGFASAAGWSVGVPFRLGCTGFHIGDYSNGVGILPKDAEKGDFYEVPLSEIDGITLDFLHENIEVSAWQGDTVRLQLTSDRALSDEDLMRFGIVNGKLVAESGLRGSITPAMLPNLKITGSVPESAALPAVYSAASGGVAVNGGGYTSLYISTASGEASAYDIQAKDLNIDTASGGVDAKNIDTDVFDVNTASGGVDVAGTCRKEFTADTASGSVRFEGTSGFVDINTMSGSIKADVGGLKEFSADTASGGVDLVCRDADNLSSINIDSVSGGVGYAGKRRVHGRF